MKSALLFFLSFSLVLGCRNRPSIPFHESLFVARPETTALRFSPAVDLQWQFTNPDSIKAPVPLRFSLKDLPVKPFVLKDFKPLEPAYQEKNLDWRNIRDSVIDLDSITGNPLHLAKSLLPDPTVVHAGAPHLLKGSSTGIMQLSVEEGLPGAMITALVKDDAGIMWVGTDKGLCRYTGDSLLVYSFVKGETITKMARDAAGDLWIITESDGLYILNTTTGILSHAFFSNILLDIDFDRSGNAWIGGWGNGLYLIDRDKKSWKTIITKDSSARDRSVFALTTDRDDNVWISYLHHVVVIDASRKKAKTMSTANGLNGSRTFNFFQDKAGTVWLENSGLNGVSIREGKMGILKSGKNRPGLNSFMSEAADGSLWIAGNDTMFIVNSQRTKMREIHFKGKTIDRYRGAICQDGQGNLWVGTLDNGILIFDQSGSMPENFDDQSGLEDVRVWGLNEDAEGNIWICKPTAVNIYTPRTRQLRTWAGNNLSRKYRPINDSAGNIILPSADGFSVVNLSQGKLINYESGQGFRHEYGASMAAVGDPGEVWLVLREGIGRYDTKKNTLATITRSGGLLSDTTWDVKVDRKKNIWIGTDSGVVVIDPALKTAKYLRVREGLCHNTVSKIFVRANGDVWVATLNGISVINTEKGIITNLNARQGLLPARQYDLTEQGDDMIAGSEDGIILISPPKDRGNGMSAHSGWSIVNFGKNYGFPVNDYNQATAITTRSGQLWMPATPILTVVDGKLAAGVPAKVYLSGIQILDHSLSFLSARSVSRSLSANDTVLNGGNRYLTRNHFSPDTGYLSQHQITWDSVTGPFKIPSGLILPADQNYLSFSFINPAIRGREKIVYSYLLEGEDKSWSPASIKSVSKNYYNLSPGDYVFKVVSRGVNGIWSAPDEMRFVIRLPWWKKWWAIFSYILFSALVIFVIVKFRSAQLEKENARLEAAIQQRTLELSRSLQNLKSTQAQLVQSEKLASLGQLTAGVAHEIQNPLNFVNNFSDLSAELIEEWKSEFSAGNSTSALGLAEDIRQNLLKINQHGKRADAIVKSMMQHSRQTGLTKENTDLNALCDEYLRLSYHGLRAKDKDFQSNYTTDFDSRLEKISVVPQDIGRVMLNLFNNAFYSVNEKRKVAQATYRPLISVSTRSLNDAVEIIVTDNGAGIPPAVLGNIFQPFFTTKPTGEGTGLGLSLSYEIIVSGHGGTIRAESDESQGTIFIIRLPL